MRDLQGDVDRDGEIGPLDFEGHVITIHKYEDTSYQGKAIPPGRWYHVMGGGESLGLIDGSRGSAFYSFRPYEVGQALGLDVRSFGDAIAYLVARD